MSRTREPASWLSGFMSAVLVLSASEAHAQLEIDGLWSHDTGG